MNQRIVIRIEDSEKEKIQQRIKTEYPSLKNTSEIRLAFREFLDKGSNQSRHTKVGL